MEISSSDALSGIDKIYYTLDGSTPDNTKTEYTGAISINGDYTLKAIAYDKAENASDIKEASYEIKPTIFSETTSTPTSSSVTVTWTTDSLATSRVIYDTVSHAVLGSAPNYGYANSTVEDPTLVTSHSVGISGLTAGTTYYYRTISHGSPETVGEEKTFNTASAPTGGGGGGGDGLGCAVRDCSGNVVGGGAQVLAAVTQAAQAFGFGPEVLGASVTPSPTPTPTPSPTPAVLGGENKTPQTIFAPTAAQLVSIIVALVLAISFGLWLSQRLKRG